MLCLRVPTDRAWADEALGDVDAVLADHAHCEMKAASNALSLAARHPEDSERVKALTDLAREEIDHFQRVFAILVERGGTLGPPPVDLYAAELRRRAGELSRDSRFPPVVDRLLVGALIEARSCERFKLLGEATAARPEHRVLHVFWTELLGAEARHYRGFVDLAQRAVASGDRLAVEARLDDLARIEGDIVVALARGGAGSRATIHG